ncbi:MAG: hypothetical protein MJ209_04745 [archaeon]|nr:hypothetical protein [archaeon]
MKTKHLFIIILVIAIIGMSSFVFAEGGNGGSVPPAIPNDEGGGDMGGMNSNENLNLTAVLEVIGKTISESGKTFTATKADQS